MGSGRTIVALVVACACACEYQTPRVVPMRGPAPERLLLAPSVGRNLEPDVLAAFDRGVRSAVERRGYSTVPVEVARRMLEELGWSQESGAVDELPLRGLHEQFGVEAVLATEVEPRADAGYSGGTLRAVWQIRDASSGRPLWRTELVGSPRQAERPMLTGPLSDPDLFFSDEPVLGRHTGSWTTEREPESLQSFADQFQREMARRLPLHDRR